MIFSPFSFLHKLGLFLKSKCSKFFSLVRSGIFPEKKLLERTSISKFSNLLIFNGISPENLLLFISKCPKFTNFFGSIIDKIFPDRLLFFKIILNSLNNFEIQS